MRPHRHMSGQQRMEIQSIPVPESGCHLWIGAVAGGYGQIMVDGARQPAHRYALSLRLGRPIRPLMLACHKCDTPLCVNPDHLYEGTLLDNAADAVARGQQLRGDELRGKFKTRCRGRRHHSNKLTEEQVVEIRNSTFPAKRAARDYGVSATTVRKIRKGEIWKHLLPQPIEEMKA